MGAPISPIVQHVCALETPGKNLSGRGMDLAKLYAVHEKQPGGANDATGIETSDMPVRSVPRPRVRRMRKARVPRVQPRGDHVPRYPAHHGVAFLPGLRRKPREEPLGDAVLGEREGALHLRTMHEGGRARCDRRRRARSALHLETAPRPRAHPTTAGRWHQPRNRLMKRHRPGLRSFSGSRSQGGVPINTPRTPRNPSPPQ